jgi:hypothetical protein
MVLGMIPMGFADSHTAGEQLKDLGLVTGYPDGTLGEANNITRAEMMVQLSRINGKFEEAKSFALPSTFTDVPATHWASPYIAYAELNEWTAGVGGGKYDPNGLVTLQQAAVFMLKSLGYVADVDFNWTNAVEVATGKGLIAGVSVAGNVAVTRGQLFTVMLNTVNAMLKDGSMTLMAKLGFVTQGVKSATVTGAKVFTVSFNLPVDTTKVSFAVKTGFVVYAPTVTWSADKTTATLTNAFNYAAGEYSITVTGVDEVKDAVKLTVAAPKESAVVIKSAQLQKSAASVLKVELVNQYGEKITDVGSLFTVTAYNITKSVGVAVTSGADNTLNLTDAAIGDNIRVTVIHNTSALTAQATLPVTAVAAANSIQFGAIELPTTVSRLVKNGTFKVAITAADQFGNVIKFAARTANVDTVANVEKIGTISFYSSDNTVVSIDKMTVDSDGKLNFVAENKAGTVIITAISDSGTTSQFTVQVFDTAAVKTFEIASPSTIVVAAESIEVPYMATNTYGEQVAKKDFDAAYQAGVTFVTSHSATGGTVTTSWSSTNQLKITANMAGTIVVTPVVDGKFSQSLTLTVNAVAVPTVFTGVKDKVTKFLETGTTTIKATDLLVKDQYGRDFDFAATGYTLALSVAAGTDGANVVATGTMPVDSSGGVTLTGQAAVGTDEITISITGAPLTTALEHKYSVATIAAADVKTYAINEIKTIFAKSDLTVDSDHAVEVVTVGKTIAGESVAIPASYFTSVTSSDLNVVNVDSAARKIWGLKEGTVTIAVFNGGTKLAERAVVTSTVTPYPVSAAFADESYVVATTLDLATKLTVKDQYGVTILPVGVWTSSAPAKFTVSSVGVVTKVAGGETTISFVSNNGLVAQVVVK